MSQKKQFFSDSQCRFANLLCLYVMMSMKKAALPIGLYFVGMISGNRITFFIQHLQAFYSFSHKKMLATF